jgi:hypothetical protein
MVTLTLPCCKQRLLSLVSPGELSLRSLRDRPWPTADVPERLLLSQAVTTRDRNRRLRHRVHGPLNRRRLSASARPTSSIPVAETPRQSSLRRAPKHTCTITREGLRRVRLLEASPAGRRARPSLPPPLRTSTRPQEPAGCGDPHSSRSTRGTDPLRKFVVRKSGRWTDKKPWRGGRRLWSRVGLDPVSLLLYRPSGMLPVVNIFCVLLTRSICEREVVVEQVPLRSIGSLLTITT